MLYQLSYEATHWEVTGSNPVEALIFSGFFFPIVLIGKFTSMIILHFDLQPQFKYVNYFIYTSHKNNLSSEVCNKTRSPPASLPFRSQVTKHTTVKWSIATSQCRSTWPSPSAAEYCFQTGLTSVTSATGPLGYIRVWSLLRSITVSRSRSFVSL